ncbi:short-chain dehydrogenases/reductase, putative [Talaromyces stipitatus ATCC 10500]|uniref:Short-chain dehydrogenases/reductase, putative n=1 Tax=Talaromyces stipitatus (strain ATCC 10500 / CBS 375.48 / QM 6759 / NRRL 1006) TaxID=441959 RepID=B8MQB6_TALSN|nr:short-chain dehydrogenases/reductase, putative [Talaromyces stipitatus ATCC 10500]EED13318.1 short-chain dehydrogenases/reductase, putative [Talaromyces stipitatus ATCC 10500]
MSSPTRTVLTTGCSDGGMGAALALAFHKAGFNVIATARNPNKMSKLRSAGVETMALDVLSDASIAEAASRVSTLDILVNNAGTSYSMPIADMDIEDAKRGFETNVWAQIKVIQAFLPLLLKSKGMIVNHTSVVSTMGVPFQSAYSASKAAMATFSDSMRLELEPFGITVVELKTGAVATNIIKNQKENTPISLPPNSIYAPAREAVESAMRNDKMSDVGTPPDRWAAEVVGDLTKKKPPAIIWRGYNAKTARLGTILPHGMMDSTIKKLTGLDVVEQKYLGSGLHFNTI